jgi:NADPH-dependent ferric siderophore reductase
MMDDIINQSGLPMHPDAPARRVERVRHELRRREVEVVRVERLSPGFVALTFGSEALDGFLSLSFDDHVKFLVEDGAGQQVGRDYTPRRFDAARRELTIEFALHGDGVASNWARAARVGSRAVIGGPRGSMIIPTDYDWHLLAGDDTALPAIRRRLEELPASSRALVIVQADEADRLLPATQGQPGVQWVADGEQLLQAVQALQLPPGEGYAWVAGEASLMARVRGVLLADKKHPKEAMRVAAYWKPGASAHHENLEA